MLQIGLRSCSQEEEDEETERNEILSTRQKYVLF